ncbi:OB-fold-containig protein [Methylobacterium gregans]|uniref:Inner membrane protein YqiJ n=1 Tax=Methylobacterium gregans TaxID=374424 RepID=A0AA37MA43_9HYPH|nr:OB-fold-containig protein [Methylobacterium gregans]MDQ0520982.1 membrane protein implicated in regulation of membrane protease activity [Methylobacterium gregans]GJD77911.1 Inner membrane protein YqiJ [Methylobacterium gregans]GLS54148.1 membrane protein [Methylobacterium gregans]
MSALAGPALFPFSLAAAVMAGLVLVEVLSLLVGHSASALVDGALGQDAGLDNAVDGPVGTAHAHGALSPAALLSWLNVGRVPFLILLILGLAAFALAGFALQGLAAALVAPLPVPLAVLAAGAAALPVLRVSTRVLARLIPRDESYAVSADDLVGAIAEVTLGPLDQGLPGQVRALDRHGNPHLLRARAAPDAPAMPAGARVLLVDRADGVFVAIPAAPDL